jgi:hypothetical protein
MLVIVDFIGKLNDDDVMLDGDDVCRHDEGGM